MYRNTTYFYRIIDSARVHTFSNHFFCNFRAIYTHLKRSRFFLFCFYLVIRGLNLFWFLANARNVDTAEFASVQRRRAPRASNFFGNSRVYFRMFFADPCNSDILFKRHFAMSNYGHNVFGMYGPATINITITITITITILHFIARCRSGRPTSLSPTYPTVQKIKNKKIKKNRSDISSTISLQI